MPSEPFIGQIMLWPGNFAPRGWAFCDGQLLPVAQNTPLFAVISHTYGGNGRTNFALPDLRGRAPLHAGAGPGLTPRALGEKGGASSAAVDVAELGERPPDGTIETVAASPPAGELDVEPPFHTVNFIIALEGLWPSRP